MDDVSMRHNDFVCRIASDDVWKLSVQFNLSLETFQTVWRNKRWAMSIRRNAPSASSNVIASRWQTFPLTDIVWCMFHYGTRAPSQGHLPQR
jgi:hypothetical protein